MLSFTNSTIFLYTWFSINLTRKTSNCFIYFVHKKIIKKVEYSTTFSMAGASGFEPERTVLETVILPLYYAPKKW